MLEPAPITSREHEAAHDEEQVDSEFAVPHDRVEQAVFSSKEPEMVKNDNPGCHSPNPGEWHDLAVGCASACVT
jgi:hypothetical protein